MDKFLYGWFLPITLSFTLALVGYLIFRDNVCVVNGDGMNPNFLNGETIAVRKFQHVKINDILLIDSPLKRQKKKPNYSLKRCVALPGDTVKISEKKLFVNGNLQSSDFCQFNRRVMLFSKEEARVAVATYGITAGKITNMTQIIPISERVFNRIQHDSLLRYVTTDITSKELSDRCLYPFSSFFRWNKDFYGPLIVPKKGMTIKLTTSNIVFYRHLLENFENTKLEYKNGQCYINGKVTENYTFKKNYYFLLNDYRDDPSDSRTFGPIPEDLIFAKYCGLLIGKNKDGEIDYEKSFKITLGKILF